MNQAATFALRHLNDRERSAVLSYLTTVRDRLRENLTEVWLFGSAARGDMWSADSPMHSDIDLLVRTVLELDATIREELVNETYPLFLECGRQISPQFRPTEWLENPPNEKARDFIARLRDEGKMIYPESGPRRGRSR